MGVWAEQMVIKVKNKGFWETILSPEEYDTYIKPLFEKGVTLVVAFTKISAIKDNKLVIGLDLPINTTAIMKAASKGEGTFVGELIKKFLGEVGVSVGIFPSGTNQDCTVPTSIETPLGKFVIASHASPLSTPVCTTLDQSFSNPIQGSTSIVDLPNPFFPKISLKDATQLGQKVKGTSEESEYIVIALGQVNIAARLGTNGELSIRAEPRYVGIWPSNSAALLSDQGMVVKGNYASMHMLCEKVSPGRVIGAFLFDVGINFEHKMINFKGFQNVIN